MDTACQPKPTIYNCIYAQPVGELKRELVACLRHTHNKLQMPHVLQSGIRRLHFRFVSAHVTDFSFRLVVVKHRKNVTARLNKNQEC